MWASCRLACLNNFAGSGAQRLSFDVWYLALGQIGQEHRHPESERVWLREVVLVWTQSAAEEEKLTTFRQGFKTGLRQQKKLYYTWLLGTWFPIILSVFIRGWYEVWQQEKGFCDFLKVLKSSIENSAHWYLWYQYEDSFYKFLGFSVIDKCFPMYWYGAFNYWVTNAVASGFSFE